MYAPLHCLLFHLAPIIVKYFFFSILKQNSDTIVDIGGINRSHAVKPNIK